MANVEELVARFDIEEDLDAEVEEVIAMGKSALPALTRAVLDTARSAEARSLAAELIGQVVPEGVDWLLDSLSTLNEEAGNFAAWGLRFNFAPQRIERALFDLVPSAKPHARLNAARALQYIHVDLKSWDPVILGLVEDSDPRVRAAGMELLIELAEAEVLYERVSPSDLASILRLAGQDPSPEVSARGEELGQLVEESGPETDPDTDPEG